MALTLEEQRLASKWWVAHVFKGPQNPAVNDYPEIKQAILDGDAWISAAPGEGATNAASFKAAIPITFKNALSAGGYVVNDMLTLLFAAIAMARAGVLPGQG